MAPLAALMEQVSHHSDEVSIEDVQAATLIATELIDYASDNSHIRRQTLVSSINKTLPEVAPNFFGPDFSRRAKDHLDQVQGRYSSSETQHPSGY